MIKMLLESAAHAAMISVFVFAMMVIIDYVSLVFKGKLAPAARRSRAGQYIFASFLGATPGCLGSFLNVSLFIRGLMSFGAITGAMVATSGDESFVMLSMFPGKALLLFTVLFALGIIVSYITDRLVPVFDFTPCEQCDIELAHDEKECHPLTPREMLAQFGRLSLERFLFLFVLLFFIIAFATGLMAAEESGWIRSTMIATLAITILVVISVNDHYLNEHIWNHIAKKHLWRVFLWTFGAIFIIGVLTAHWDMSKFLDKRMGYVLILAALVGIIPESGPHLVFVVMFSKGLIPFSVLLASSIVQDGHGLLPLLSYSLKDVIRIKAVNLAVGLLVGGALYLAGM